MWKQLMRRGGMACMLAFTIVSCKQPVPYEEKVGDALERLLPGEVLNRYRHIVLVPNGGCPGCVSEAEDYCIRHQADSTLLFVFTNFVSRKELRIKLGKTLLERKNVWLDDELNLYFPEYKESIYPALIEVKNGKIGRFANLEEAEDTSEEEVVEAAGEEMDAEISEDAEEEEIPESEEEIEEIA